MLMGLLWFDNDPHRSVVAKVEEAARRYREKFGITPNTCYVNQATLNGQELTVPFEGRALRVLPASNILAHHFWIGKDDLIVK
jgi:hypothetical protein